MIRTVGIKLVLAGASTMFMYCSAMPSSSPVADHPVPATHGVLPLQIDNKWQYFYRMFDSTGKQITFPQDTLSLAITGIYLRSGDTLEDIKQFVDENEIEREMLVYQYEWDNRDSGYLVSHKSTGVINKRGLYIVGEFDRDKWQLFDSARLWYSYPCEQNFSWTVLLPGEGRDTCRYVCVSTEDTAWITNVMSTSMNPLTFLGGCYTYKQTIDDYTYFHQFHPEYGKISLRGYKNGVLRECFHLINWTLSK